MANQPNARTPRLEISDSLVDKSKAERLFIDEHPIYCPVIGLYSIRKEPLLTSDIDKYGDIEAVRRIYQAYVAKRVIYRIVQTNDFYVTSGESFKDGNRYYIQILHLNTNSTHKAKYIRSSGKIVLTKTLEAIGNISPFTKTVISLLDDRVLKLPDLLRQIIRLHPIEGIVLKSMRPYSATIKDGVTYYTFWLHLVSYESSDDKRRYKIRANFYRNNRVYNPDDQTTTWSSVPLDYMEYLLNSDFDEVTLPMLPSRVGEEDTVFNGMSIIIGENNQVTTSTGEYPLNEVNIHGLIFDFSGDWQIGP